MALYIFGKTIPTNLTIRNGLRKLYGLNIRTIDEICARLSCSPHEQLSNLSDTEISILTELIETNYEVESDLRQRITYNLERLVRISSLRGIRHGRGLPVRGQRTHTNAKTQRRLSPLRWRKARRKIGR